MTENKNVFPLSLIVADVAVMILAFLLASIVLYGEPPQELDASKAVLWPGLFFAGWLAIMAGFGLYRPRGNPDFGQTGRDFIKALGVILLSSLAALALLNTEKVLPADVALSAVFFGLLVRPARRAIGALMQGEDQLLVEQGPAQIIQPYLHKPAHSESTHDAVAVPPLSYERRSRFRDVAIMGTGMVGGALERYFISIGIKPRVYDKFQRRGSLAGINDAEVIFVAVPTPFDEQKESFDDSYLRNALDQIKGAKIVVIKSTVLPGTTEKLQKEYPQFRLMVNPEFLTEQTADQDMKYPDRQLLGYTTQSYSIAGEILALLPLAPFERIVPASVAEMAKYFGNNWFSVKVVFANQMYDLCRQLAIDYDLVKECAAADKRIGRSHLDIFHKGYRGYSGKCLPKDIRALIKLADERGIDLRLHKTVEEINNELVKQQELAKDR